MVFGGESYTYLIRCTIRKALPYREVRVYWGDRKTTCRIVTVVNHGRERSSVRTLSAILVHRSYVQGGRRTLG
jgi:hypothetical protein